jgi:hypothetical protein
MSDVLGAGRSSGCCAGSRARKTNERGSASPPARRPARWRARCARWIGAREAAAGSGFPDEDEDDERRVGVVLRCSPHVRARWWHARQVANRVAGHTLSAAAFVEALTGEVLSAVPLDGALAGLHADAGDEVNTWPTTRRRPR